MSTVEFVPFHPDQATDEEFRAYYDMVMANHAVERAEMAPTSYEAYVSRLRTMSDGADPAFPWQAKEDGAVIGVATLELPAEENTHFAYIEVIVHPDRRREGIGTDFFKVLLAEARAAGRTRVVGSFIRVGSAGEPWVARMGFQPGLAFTLQQLDVADVDPALWDVPTPDGYRLVFWSGPAPEDIVVSYAEARGAIADAVNDGLTLVFPDWTPERVRMEEEEVAAADSALFVVVAVHEATGKVAAITQLASRNAQPAKGFQHDTAVVRGHRGHGLGRAVKAAMLRHLAVERPGLKTIATQTADTVHMARINHEVGYRTLWTQSFVEADLAELEARVGVATQGL